MRRRYPLETLRELRAAAVTRRARSLGERAAEHERAERAASAARAAREAATAEERAVVSRERGRLEAGEAKAGDLVLGDDYSAGAAARAATLAGRERAASGEAAAAAAREAAARAELGQARAAEKALEHHRSRWSLELARQEELATEEAALDHWASRRGERKPEGSR